MYNFAIMFYSIQLSPRDVLHLTDAEFSSLGIDRLGDRVRLREKCRDSLKGTVHVNVLSLEFIDERFGNIATVQIDYHNFIFIICHWALMKRFDICGSSNYICRLIQIVIRNIPSTFFILRKFKALPSNRSAPFVWYTDMWYCHEIVVRAKLDNALFIESAHEILHRRAAKVYASLAW